MEDKIVNRVAQSKLQTIDLEELYPEGERYSLDIAQWLYEGVVLREKEFRAHVRNHDWSQYKDGFLAISCSSDAIVPAWAYLLLSLSAGGHAQKVVVGNRTDLETILFAEVLAGYDPEPYRGLPVVIKGCANKPVPENAYILLAEKLQPVARSIMYGEACSAVPLFKQRRRDD